jgi:hypothetical protein
LIATLAINQNCFLKNGTLQNKTNNKSLKDFFEGGRVSSTNVDD